MGFLLNATFGFGLSGSSSGVIVDSANNGLSLNGSTVVLGQNVGQSGDPAALLSNREIPLSGFTVAYKGTNGTITVNNQAEFLIANNDDQPWYLTSRRIGLSFPVPTIRPGTSNKVLAFDLMPNGTPTVSTGDPIVWLDICDTDVYNTNTGTVVCARASANTNAVDFGVAGFGSGVVLKPVHFIMGVGNVIGQINIDNSVQWNTSSFTIQKNGAGAVISWLLNSDTGNSSELFIIGQDFSTAKFGFIRYNNAGVSPNFYINPNQLEVLSNVGATNGLVLGALGTGNPIKFVQGGNAHLATLNEVARFSGVGFFGIGTLTPDNLFHPELSDAVTGAVSYPVRVTHISTGTTGTGFGVGMQWEAQNASGTNRVVATFDFPYTDATDATEDTDYVLNLIDAGTLSERMRVTSDGAIMTADPGLGRGAWMLGKVITAASTLDTTKYVEVKIDGVVVKLATMQ